MCQRKSKMQQQADNNSYNATLQCAIPGQVDISQMTQEWVYQEHYTL